MVLFTGVLITLTISIIFAIGIIFIKRSQDQLAQLSYQNRLFKALRELDIVVLSTTDIETLCRKIVDTVHRELGYFFSSIVLVDERAGGLRRIAVSGEAAVLREVRSVPIEYTKQVVPFRVKENLLVKAANEGRSTYTDSLYDIQRGIFQPEVSRKIQTDLGIKGFFIYPIIARNNKILGVIVYSPTIEKEKLSAFEYTIMEEFTVEVSRALDNVMLYENLNVVSKQLEKANLKLLELDQLKDDFVSVASHELRTPMAAIKSYAWMALNRSGIKLPDKLVRYLIRVLLSSERLINLVNDLLNISRIESGRIEINPEEVDMISLIRDIADEVYYSKSKEKNIQIVILEQKLPKVLADPEKLRQVLLNIMGNAVKFSSNGGKITVGFFTDGITVETNILDQGPGISKDDIGRLFQKFGRLDNSYVATATSGGTGLGLYISKSLTELMHGKIRASSEGLGKGATFTLSLPVATRENILHKESFRIRAKGEVKGLEPVAI